MNTAVAYPPTDDEVRLVLSLWASSEAFAGVDAEFISPLFSLAYEAQAEINNWGPRATESQLREAAVSLTAAALAKLTDGGI